MRYVSDNISMLKKAGSVFLGGEDLIRVPCFSLAPLAIALFETADLFQDLGAESHDSIHLMFDGGDDESPNAYTRLRCIRDLCSATSYGLGERSFFSTTEESRQSVLHDCDPSSSSDEQSWLALIKPHVATNDDMNVIEVARLLDDVLEAFVCIAHEVLQPQDAIINWGEISRHSQHIRDHFDYAENFLLECLRPSEE